MSFSHSVYADSTAAAPHPLPLALGMAAVLSLAACLGGILAGESSIWGQMAPWVSLLTALLALVDLRRQRTLRLAGERAAADAAARLAGMLDSAMDAIITVDQDQRIVLYNRAAEKVFGWPVAEIMGQSLETLMPARFHASHREHLGRFAAKGATSRRMGDGTVIHGRRANGEEFPLDASISQLDTPDGKLFTVILRDVTERIRAQEELAAYAAGAHAVREQEKTRVARELHDELAQSLTALKMDTIWVQDNLTASPEKVGTKLADMLAMLDRSVAATRRIAADLRPLLLDDLGLVPAIEWLAQNFTQRNGVPCELVMDEELDLAEPHATAVFRIVQESLANVAKHAGASRVSVQLSRVAGELLLCVRDDGRGFTPEAPRKPSSLGLVGLRERVQLLKGKLWVASEAGHGTTVEVRIPLPQQGTRD
jgi:PAS domain S-box-containing protein